MKKVAIAADNYKLEKFREELTIAGFDKFIETPFPGLGQPRVTIITLYIREWRKKDIQKICEKVELYFKNQQEEVK
jgi:nitrogen regulatory protein PII